MLHYTTVDPQTLELLKKIQICPVFNQLRLVGGTGLALQYGHRKSVDIDLFGNINTENIEIKDNLNKIGELKTISISKYIKIFTVNGIKVDIVNYPYPWLFKSIVEDNINLADDKDIAAMKLSAITNRGTKKDFIDIYFLLQKYSLKSLMSFYEKKYHDGSIFLVLKSLMYFVDAENEQMPEMLLDTDWNTIKKYIIAESEKY